MEHPFTGQNTQHFLFFIDTHSMLGSISTAHFECQQLSEWRSLDFYHLKMWIFSGFEHFHNCENQQVSSISSSISTARWRRRFWGNESIIKKSTFKCSGKTHKPWHCWQAWTHESGFASGFEIRLELLFRSSLLVIYMDWTNPFHKKRFCIRVPSITQILCCGWPNEMKLVE